MASNRELLTIIREYKRAAGKKFVEMPEVARWAASNGWAMPKPISPIDLFAKALSRAARQELRYDEQSGKPYRAHQYFTTGKGQLGFWVETDDATRGQMLVVRQLRREHTIGEMYQLELDLEHWHAVHPQEAPIPLEKDLTDDVEWRKNAPDEEDKAG